ncbi:ATP-binding cassette domain-containing protein [Leisingera sp. S232]|uniref:ATP-binding cassette domain-containing protein n=1 Tax=Leisingera sp. S232 TaxID=3415132 RepID=UPI003C7B56CF
MAEFVLHIRNLGVQLSRDFAVVIEALDLAPGERLVLDSESGTGKSTVLGLIAGAITYDNYPGRTHLLMGHDMVSGLPREQRAGPDRLGYVLQTNTLVPYLNVLDNICLPLRLAELSEDLEWRAHLLKCLGLLRLIGRMPATLSVGQRQRVSVARALLGRPALLMLDEPVASLDVGNAAKVEALISTLAEEAGSAVLLASHQAQSGLFSTARRLSHRSFAHEGATYSVFSDPILMAEGQVRARA